MSKTILTIHGFGAAGESWTPVAARFKAAGYMVETPTIHASLRTVGPPPAGLAGKTLAHYVAEMSDLAQSIAQRDGERPVVFGHSMGGMIAQKLAEAGLVSGAVLFAPASPADARGKPKFSPVFTFLNIVLASKPETRAVKIWKTGFKWGVLNQTPAARHDAIFATTVHDSGQALADLAYPDRDPNKTVSIDASKVTVPVMILAGTRDRTTPIEDLRLVGRKYASATFKEYPENAHWLIDEPGSDRILADVGAWLDAQGLGAKPAVKAAPAAKPAAAPAAAKPAATAKPAPVPKVASAPEAKATIKAPAKAAPKPVPKAAPAPEAKSPVKAAPVAAPAVAKAAPAKIAPKAPAKTATAPKVAKIAPAPAPVTPAKPKTAAKPKVVAKSAAMPAVAKAAAPKPPVVAKPAPVAKAPPTKAKPAVAAKPAPTKASTPTKPSAKSPAKSEIAKAPVTKATAKSSPAPKKSV